MKYIAKMMLALLASVTLVIPAYAWDFQCIWFSHAQAFGIKPQPKQIKMLMQCHPWILEVHGGAINLEIIPY